MSGNKEFDPKRDLFLVESFISNRSNVDARQFSQLEKDILEKEKAINMLKSNPEKFADYLADHPEDPALVKAFNKQVSSQLNELRQAANQVRRDPAISRIDKAEMLKENKILQNKVKKNIFDLMDPLVD
jgi:vacuolar-type H+-ATPase subunit I/STV1